MNTPGHALLNLALLGRRERPARNRAIVAGAVVPDVPIVLFYLWERLARGAPEPAIWGTLYFDPAWQRVFDMAHSLPLAATGLLTALGLRAMVPPVAPGAPAPAGAPLPAGGSVPAGARSAAAFFASVGVHSLCDLPLHHDDAHRHFFPLSDWRFASPVSYWDPHHHGAVAALAEVIAVLASALVLGRRRLGWRANAAIAAVALLYVAGYAALYLA